MLRKFFKDCASHKVILILTAVILATQPGFSQDTLKERVNAIVLEGTALHGKKDFDGAIAKYTEAIGLANRSGDIYFARGVSYSAKKDHANAVKDFTSTLELPSDPKFKVAARRLRAIMNLNLKAYQATIDDVDLLASEGNATFQDYFFRARAKMELQNLEGAIADFTKVIEGSPKDHNGFVWRSRCYAGIKNLEKARNDLTSAIGLNPSEPLIYTMRAKISRQMGKTAEAEEDEKKAHELEAKPKP